MPQIKNSATSLSNEGMSQYYEHMEDHIKYKNHPVPRTSSELKQILTFGNKRSFVKQTSFLNPFNKRGTTFGYVKNKIEKKVFDREYTKEFRGQFSPPPTKYLSGKSEFDKEVYEGKTLPRD